MTASERQPAPKRRAHVLFEGFVQGVGFRYTTLRLAGDFRVTGYVRNLPDGNVEVVAEGDEAEVLAFIQKIKASGLGRYIRGEHFAWSPATGEFREFTIQFGY